MNAEFNCYNATTEWYKKLGYKRINECLQELTNYSRIYIENFEVLPQGVSKKAIVCEFNADSNAWTMKIDNEGDLVCEKRHK